LPVAVTGFRLTQIDGKLPSLALMELAHYHRCGQPFRAREVNLEAMNLKPIGFVVLVPHRLQANAVREADCCQPHAEDHCEGH
jgi:hypothetical protein